jgi:diaminopimelate epimerase
MKFTKMHGLGNDFIIVEPQEAVKSGFTYPELAEKVCHRQFGVGADGLIIVNPPDMPSGCDISWRIFNSDGSEPQMCGNGIRCFARYVHDRGIIDKNIFSVSTLAGAIVPEVLSDGRVRVDMGEPILTPAKIPVAIGDIGRVINYPIEAGGRKLNCTAVSMGNPHCVIFTDKDSAQMAKTLGSILEKHSLFPEKTNVEFVEVLSRDKIRVDVWERGCGITLACGTGACASVVATVLNGHTDRNVEVELPGGNLFIEWREDTNRLFMTGGCETVFEGEYRL